MSGTDFDTKNTPMGEPAYRKDETRGTLVGWFVGEPDADGYRPMAHLSVYYFKRSGYTATLRAARLLKADHGVDVDLGFMATAPKVVVLSTPATRYSATTLSAELDRAIGIVRERFTQGAADVVPFFDPTAAPHVD
ncbi:hypothetical protein ALI22I_20565 [Saccharothrix sp. ALI-22-I]|uniref:hypothetical protein n=1 Tax=Saccharothrix sp. ALI-22-I TaxID=1933778 RepID=UPI00097C6D10|nr:hypothetical protein [Saccharothrix sp. ALI-22-I]ONI88133.1 hypothetical protein ALI22I_20565 [Saccharothrix sp. ALI-22-I]